MRRILGLLLLISIANTALAVRVNSIYEANVNVVSQSASVKDKMLPQALAQVLVKVSGKTSVLDNPGLASHLGDAFALMQQYSYLPDAKPNSATPYVLRVSFDPDGVNRLLRDSKASVWGIDRPLILAWIDFEMPNHPAEIIGSDSISDIQTVLREQANLRGIPIILPVMDMTDLNAVSVNDIATMSVAKLQTASNRYASDAILIIRLLRLTDGYSAQAKLVLGNDNWDWNIHENSLNEVLNTLINNMADTLASRYSSVITNAVQTHLTLSVTGVAAQDDFAQLMRYISHMTAVASAEPLKIDGDRVVLSISLRGTKDAFIQAISLDKKLTPAASSEKENNLAYQWNH